MCQGKVWIHRKRLVVLFDGSVMLAGEVKRTSQTRIHQGRERIKFPGSSHLSNGFVEAPHCQQLPAIPMMSQCIAGLEFNGSLEVRLPSRPTQVIKRSDHCQGGIGLGDRVINLECFQSRRFCFGKGLLWWRFSQPTMNGVTVSQSGIGQRVGGIYLNCLLKELNALPQPFFCSLIEEVAAFEISMMSL